jgi:hypothetical protein
MKSKHRFNIGFTFTMAVIIVQAMTCSATVNLDLSLTSANNLQVFFLQDLNVSGQAPASQVFRATIQSDEPAQSCRLEFSMRTAQLEIFNSSTGFFTLNPGVIQLTNLDLTSVGSPYRLENFSSNSVAQSIEEQLLQNGYFPAATYYLSLKLWSSAQTLLAADEVVAVITNPFTTMLLVPAGTPESPAPIGGVLPLFSWSSSATQFLITICERTSDDPDPESVMQSRPHYQTDPASPLTGKSFSYPAAGVKPLESGHTYYWQVTALVQTTSGLKEYPSPIGAFTILQSQSPDAVRILTAIQRILGPGYLSALNQLTGFQPTGEIRMNGVIITIEDLETTATEFESGVHRITSARAE